MNKTLRRALILVLVLILAGSLVMLLLQQKQYHTGEDTYKQAEELAEMPNPAPEPEKEEVEPEETILPDVYAEAMQDIDLVPVKKVNGDAIGWIRIPDTQLSYPLMQGDDNEYYLDHAWNGEATSVGSIFLEHQCSADLTDFNTIIYGHRMLNGSMFASLKYYNQLSYWEEHPYVYIKDEERTHRYAVFAAYEAPVQSYTYALSVEKAEVRQKVIDFALEQSVIDTGIVPTAADRIVTLSTCTGNGYDSRWVVQAVETLPEGY